MPSFPLNVQISGRVATIVGGGKVALRKALVLRAGGASVRVIAPAIDAGLAQVLQDDPHSIAQRAYRTGDLAGSLLVVAATDSPQVNAQVLADARAAGILCSDASDPRSGDFTLPATLRLDTITIAVDTGGTSPGFAKRILCDIQEKLDPSYGRAAATLGVMRTYARAGLSPDERAAVMAEAVELPVAELAAMNPGQAQHCIDAIVDRRRAPAVAPATASLICATRASHLALTQTRMVAAKLAVAGIASTVLPVSTIGDRVQDRAIAAIGTENVFVSELESALRDGRAHYAVHSCKDLPSTLAGDMILAAVCAREDPRDAFCSERFESFAALPSGARVGTSSLRRRVQLLALRSDLQYVDIRGNVDTRLRKLRDGEYDAIVLAMAGLVRLGTRATHTVAFAETEIVPATGQGALAVEVLRANPSLQRIRDALNDRTCELAVVAERTTLAALGGGCQAPIGVHARVTGTELHLSAVVVSTDGAQVVRAMRNAPASGLSEAEALGRAVAAQLLASGAAAILGTARGSLSGKTIVLPRTQERPSQIAGALERDGAHVIEWRAGEAAARVLGERVPDMIVFPSSGSVSAAADLLAGWNAAERRPAVAAMGPASAAAAIAAGFPPDVTAVAPEIDPLIDAVRKYFL